MKPLLTAQWRTALCAAGISILLPMVAARPLPGQLDDHIAVPSLKARVSDLYLKSADAFFAGLPDVARKAVLEQMRLAAENSNSNDERAQRLIEVANTFRTNGFRDRAVQVLSLVIQEPDVAPRLHARANCLKGDILLVLDGDYTRSTLCFRDAVQAIDAIPEDQRTWLDGDSQLTALARLAGSLYCTDMQSQELPKLYDRILAMEPIYGETHSNTFVAIGLDAARVLTLQGRSEEAAPFHEVTLKYADQALVPPENVLYIYLEVLRGQYTWNDPKRIAKLLELWEDDKYHDQPAIMDAGNDIYWARFLDRETEREDFESFAKAFIERGEAFLKGASGDAEREDGLSKYASQAVVGLYCSQREQDSNDAEAHRERVRELRKGQPFAVRFPSGASRKQILTMDKDIENAYRALFASDQDSTDEGPEAGPQPTEARPPAGKESDGEADKL